MDNEYNCKRCGYKTDVKANLIKHLSKNKICPPLFIDIERILLINSLTALFEKKHECDKCHKKFSHLSGKYRHQKTCEYDDIEELDNVKKQVTELKEKNFQLEESLKKLQMASASNNITNITNNNQQNITINLSSFSRERIDHITPEFIKNCLKEMNMIRLLEQVHFDPEHPENHTVRVKNMNKNLLEYHQDGKWIIGNKDRVIEDMINCSGYRILKTFYRNNKEEINQEIDEEEYDSEKIIQEIDDWLTKIDKEDQKLFKELKSNIFLIILNNKAMVCAR